MIGFAKIVGGSPSSVKKMTDHLFNLTQSQERQRVAAYYEKGMVATTAEEARDIVLDHLVDDHVNLWLDGRVEPNVDLIARYAAAHDAAMSPADIEDKLRGDIEVALDRAITREFGLSEGHLELHGLGVDKNSDYLSDRTSAEIRVILDDVMARWDVALDREMYREDVKEARQEEIGHLAVLRPDMHPMVAKGLKIDTSRPLTGDEVSALLAGRRADGKKVDNKKYSKERVLPSNPKTGERRWATPIGSYDFCPTPDKSVSVAWGLADKVEQAMILNAHVEAAREAVGYIAAEVGQARLGDGGKDGFEPGHVAWLEFLHHTSRKTVVRVENGELTIDIDKDVRGDMNLHTHFLIPNAVFCDSGRVGSLDTAAIRGLIFEADGVYHARLAQKLRDAGFDVVRDERTGAARMTAISETLTKIFSKRTNAGEAIARRYTARRGETWDNLTEDQRSERIKRATQSLDQKVKGGKDDLADFQGWRAQAYDAGWRPGTFQLIGPRIAPLTEEQRIQKAYESSLPFVDQKFSHSAVVQHFDLRVAALKGLIEHGMQGLDDIYAVTKAMRQQGVRQYGEWTELFWGVEDGKRFTSVSTKLHEADEHEFVALAKRAAADTSRSTSLWLLDSKIKDFPDLDFSNKHGLNQRRAMERVASGGQFSVVIGAAGSGKTTLLKPLVAAWKEQGLNVVGSSLAWRQADDLADAGIKTGKRRDTKAFSVLMAGLKSGGIEVNRNTKVVVDELGLLGTRQGLELLRLQAKHGFGIVALGDDKQCASIEAGAIIDLTRRALGPENVPEIITTIRQKADRELEIVDLFRRGEAKTAIDMKRSDGTAEMVLGGREGVVRRAAELYMERLKDIGHAPQVLAPTNADAHQLGSAIREERRKIGEVGPDVTSIRAMDGERSYMLPIAKGDNVRLFQSTKADLESGYHGSIGRNGHIMQVMDVDQKRGLLLRNTADGKTGIVSWDALLPGPRLAAELHGKGKPTDRMMLAYGDATTIHTGQGANRRESILVLPGGSHGITSGQAYTGSTRHEWQSFLLTNEFAEHLAVKEARPLNDPHDITLDDKWANVAKQFSAKSKQDSALALLDRLREIKRGTVRTFHEAASTPRWSKASNVAMMVQAKRIEVGMKIAKGVAFTQEVARSVSHGLRR